LALEKKVTLEEFMKMVGKRDPDFVVYQGHHAEVLKLVV